MLEILVCDDYNLTKGLFCNEGIVFTGEGLAIRAMLGDECIGYCLFELEDKKETVLAINPKDDTLLADGLLRSALHVGTERGITEAFYANTDLEPLLQNINFLENIQEKRLKLQNLFADCCSCKK